MMIVMVFVACFVFVIMPFVRKPQDLVRQDWLSLGIAVLVLSITTLLFYTQKSNHIQSEHTFSEADISQSLYNKTHMETTLATLSAVQKRAYCTTMQRRYQRKLQPEWLANIATCYQKITTPEALKMAQSVMDFGLQTTPNDVALNVLHAQNVMASAGIHSPDFRAALSHLLDIAPTHRTTLWLAAAEAYYRGERSQALAYLTQLRAKVGDEPEIMAFIDAVNALPEAD